MTFSIISITAASVRQRRVRRRKMKVIKLDMDNKTEFRLLEVGDVFEYLEEFYIKTGVSATKFNAVDLLTGSVDIIRLDAEVDAMDAEIRVRPKENF
jgi:hypothetical protein